MKASERIEVVANAATVVAALLLSVVLIKVFLLPNRAGSQAAPQIQTGTDMKPLLPGVDWGKSGRTLVLALSTQCHFCTDSAPLFQEVARAAQDKVKLLAVLPQPKDEARQYLDKLGLRVDDVRQASLGSLGVPGTPTLMLVNGGGVVTDVWVGKLPPDRATQLLAALQKNEVIK